MNANYFMTYCGRILSYGSELKILKEPTGLFQGKARKHQNLPRTQYRWCKDPMKRKIQCLPWEKSIVKKTEDTRQENKKSKVNNRNTINDLAKTKRNYSKSNKNGRRTTIAISTGKRVQRIGKRRKLRQEKYLLSEILSLEKLAGRHHPEITIP